MSLDTRYDLICYGSGIATYILAALVAKSGKSVLLLNPENESHPADSLMSPIYFGKTQAQLLENIFNKFGKSFDQVPMKNNNKYIQLLFNKQRFDLNNDHNINLQEVMREVPEDYDSFDRLFKLFSNENIQSNHIILYAQYLLQSKKDDLNKLDKYFDKFFNINSNSDSCMPLHSLFQSGKNDLCYQIAQSLLAADSAAAPESLGKEQVFRTLPLLTQSRCEIVIGYKHLKDRLLKMIRIHGGDYRYGTKMESLISNHKKITGVHLKSNEGVIYTNSLALENNQHRLYSTINDKDKDFQFLKQMRKVQPKYWKYSFRCSFHKKYLPVGLADRALRVFDNESNFSEENMVILNILERDKSIGSAEDCVTILVSALVPYRASTVNYHYLRSLSLSMLDSLEDIIPFIKENIIELYPDFRRDSLDIAKVYPFEDINWIPERFIHYYVQGGKDAQGFLGIPWQTTIDNLYMTGNTVWPSLGNYGALLSIHNVFNKIKNEINNHEELTIPSNVLGEL